MKKILIYTLIIFTGLVTSSCKKFLEVQPLDRVPASQLLTDVNGVRVLLANLYSRVPMEDFVYNPGKWFSYYRESNGYIEPGFGTTFYTDESTASTGTGVGPTNDGYWGYDAIRQTNLFIEQLPQVAMSDQQRAGLVAEGRFIRAYMYFGLAKRYGGVPLIERSQEYIPGSDNANLFVPRSTEKVTWSYILSELDSAAMALPTSRTAVEGQYRVTKWAALALKSRVALHAASVAKYWSRAPLTGTAVDQGLVGGMTAADATNFYQQCIDASAAVISQSGKGLYRPTPANRAEAAKNFQDIFQNPAGADVEVLLKKGYIDGQTTLLQGHTVDVFYNPSQTNPGGLYYGRFSPTLNLVDLFEDYSDNGQGRSVPLVTRLDGNESDVVANPVNFDVNKPYKQYDNLSDIFAGKDARLHASIIVPGSTWKGVTIIMQGGLVRQDGSKIVYTNGSAPGRDGRTYFALGASALSGLSAFHNIGANADQNFSCSGFSLKKFLQEGKNVPGFYFSSTQDFIDIRLAEVFLNYAEAVVEGGVGDATLAATYLNALRRRAAHTDNIPLSLANVLKERRVEMAFEGQRYWDMIRRRENHTMFQGSRRQILVPVIDLRQPTPKYIFVRANNFYDERANGQNFQQWFYYRPIPGVSTNRLIQNPNY